MDRVKALPWNDAGGVAIIISNFYTTSHMITDLAQQGCDITASPYAKTSTSSSKSAIVEPCDPSTPSGRHMHEMIPLYSESKGSVAVVVIFPEDAAFAYHPMLTCHSRLMWSSWRSAWGADMTPPTW